MSGVTAEIAADFIVEAQEILDRLGEQLVGLEHAPDDRDQLNAVFRGFHTLKGGAGFLGITAMVELCHAAEETLGSVPGGQAMLDPRHFDAAQRSLDWLQAMLDAVAGGTEPVHAPAELVAQFSLAHAAPVAAPAPVKPPVHPAPATGNSVCGTGRPSAITTMWRVPSSPSLISSSIGRKSACTRTISASESFNV